MYNNPNTSGLTRSIIDDVIKHKRGYMQRAAEDVMFNGASIDSDYKNYTDDDETSYLDMAAERLLEEYKPHWRWDYQEGRKVVAKINDGSTYNDAVEGLLDDVTIIADPDEKRVYIDNSNSPVFKKGMTLNIRLPWTNKEYVESEKERFEEWKKSYEDRGLEFNHVFQEEEHDIERERDPEEESATFFE